MSSAPLELITGLPGNGKTLYAIKYVKEWSARENRPVFYSGIALGDELKDKWTEIDPEKWFEAPAGAIIIIDECQRIFRPRSLGKEPPDYVARLETIRHQGLNMVLITQHPLLADASIRRLCGKHMHCIRKWGTESSTIHEWASVRDNCDKSAGRKDSIKHAWKFDKSVYALYKSAEVHTIKRRIPMRVWMLLCIPFLLIAAAYAVYWLTIGKKHPVAPVGAAGVSAPAGVVQERSAAAKWQDPMADAKQFAFDATPRVVGLPHTAPKYDSVTKPTVAPVPSSCLASKERCKCYSQQATVMDVPEPMCREIVARGFFVDFQNGPPAAAQHDQDSFKDAYLVRAGAVPVVPDRTPSRAGEVLQSAPADDDATGFGVLGSRRDSLRQPGA